LSAESSSGEYGRGTRNDTGAEQERTAPLPGGDPGTGVGKLRGDAVVIRACEPVATIESLGPAELVLFHAQTRRVVALGLEAGQTVAAVVDTGAFVTEDTAGGSRGAVVVDAVETVATLQPFGATKLAVLHAQTGGVVAESFEADQAVAAIIIAGALVAENPASLCRYLATARHSKNTSRESTGNELNDAAA
jgi:hypothetical protein